MAPSFNPAKDIGSLEGKVILVTGGNAGLGKATINYLAAHNPATIYLAARTASKATAAIEEIHASSPDARIEHLPLDLTSFESIAAAAATFRARETRLHVLLNNAGVMMTPYELTKDGYELQLGTNHMGHALLTKLLLPVLLATAEEEQKQTAATTGTTTEGQAQAEGESKQPRTSVRIINVSSEGHRGTSTFGPALHLTPSDWPKQYTTTRYAESKLANILYTRELALRYPSLTCVAIHPGVILTDLFAHAQRNWIMGPLLKLYALFFPILPGHFKDARDGALNQTWVATVDKERLESGAYYLPVGKRVEGSGPSRDMGLAKKLWEWTEGEFGKHGF